MASSEIIIIWIFFHAIFFWSCYCLLYCRFFEFFQWMFVDIFYDNINTEIEAFFLKNKYAKNFNKKYLDLSLEDKHKTYIEFTTMEKDAEDAFYIIERNIKNKNLINFNDNIQSSFISLVALYSDIGSKDVRLQVKNDAGR